MPDAEKLKAYFASRSQRLTVLHGKNMKQIQTIANQFNAPFSMSPSSSGQEYDISHPGYIYLISPVGRLSMVYSGKFIEVERMNRDLSYLKSHYS